jgi:pimeloyl-ACP methyl ester carboxylesterase
LAVDRPLVLVPGACLGAWAWDDVAPRLRALGHDVHAVDLTGQGARADLAGPAVDLETHIADVLAVLDGEGLEDAVLVGHSYSGIVVTGAADRRPGRLDAVVYLDTGPIPDGMAISDLQDPAQRERQRRDVEERGDGWAWPVPDRDTIATGVYGSAAGLTDAHYRLIAERARPQPYATLTRPLRRAHARPPGVRRVAAFFSDGGVSLAVLRALMEEGDPTATVFADPDWELHELPAGHWAMLTAPEGLADLLHRIASGPRAGGQASGTLGA